MLKERWIQNESSRTYFVKKMPNQLVEVTTFDKAYTYKEIQQMIEQSQNQLVLDWQSVEKMLSILGRAP